MIHLQIQKELQLFSYRLVVDGDMYVFKVPVQDVTMIPGCMDEYRMGHLSNMFQRWQADVTCQEGGSRKLHSWSQDLLIR